jgi:hypothetical protein
VGEEENGNPKSCPVPFQRTTVGGLMGQLECPRIKKESLKGKINLIVKNQICAKDL